MTNNTNRPTLASTNARIDALMGAVEKLTGTIARRADARVAQLATTATVAEITSAPSKRARKAKASKATPAQTIADEHGVSVCKSFAAGQALVDAGADPSMVMVPKGRFGAEGAQTFADAKARRDASDAKRAEYVAKRTSERASKPNTSKSSKRANTSERTNDSNSLVGMTGAQLVALGTDAANAEIARRAAKRAARKASA